MNVSVKYYNNIKKLKNKWQEFFNLKSPPTLSFDFVKDFNSTLKQKKYSIVENGKIRYMTIEEDGCIKIILPILKKKDEINSLYLLDYFDILYDRRLDDSKIRQLILTAIKQENTIINFSFINQSSDVYRIFKDYIEVQNPLECAVIDCDDWSFNEAIKNDKLSKNSKQNIRTAYNRLKTDQKEIQLKVQDCNSIKSNLKDMRRMYVNRRKTKYKNINKFLQVIYLFKEPILDTLIKQKNVKSFSLFINNEMAAHMVGLVHGDIFYVPRLVIDEKFKRYSPGILLIIETIKKCKELNIKYLDLSTGTEEYKSTLGSIEHFNYKINVCIINNQN